MSMHHCITAVMTGGASDADASAELKKVESDLTQARQRLQDMEIEARGLSEATRREMGSKVRGDEESAPEGG